MEWNLVDGHLTISGEITHTSTNHTDWPWFSQKDNIQSVSFSNAYFTSGSNAYGMFYIHRYITSINFSGLDTSNVTNMGSMFRACYALTSLDLSNFNTSNVSIMAHMFDGCNHLISVDLSSFNTSNVTDMSGMFYHCVALQYIRISNLWTTAGVSKSASMFVSCNKLPNYNSVLTDKDKAYAGAGGYLSDDVCACYDYNLDELNFIGCYKNQYINGQTIGTNTYYTNIENMALTTAPNWLINDTIITVNFYITVKPKTTYHWFQFPVLNRINNLQLLNTSNTENMNGMFRTCHNLTLLDLSSFNTSNVTDMSYMFSGCFRLTSLNLSFFDTSNVNDMSWMFYYCSALTSLDLSSFNTSNVEDMSDMFSRCSNLTSINLSSFNTSNVTNMSYMFNMCISLTSLNLSNFNTSSVTDMGYMFQECSAIVPVLYVRQTQCITTNFIYNSQGIIYLVRDPAVAENTTVRDFWRSVANSYNNVHFEYDDATRPTVTPEISRGKLVNNQWQADELGNTIKIKLNEQVYNNNISSVLSENQLLISYEEVQNPTGNPSEQGWYEKNNEEYIQTSDTQVISGKTYYNKNTGINIEIPTAVNYVVKQDLTNNLFYITLNTDSDKQYDVNVILTDLSEIPVTHIVIAPGVFAMIEFRAGGHGMSIGKICEQDGLEVDIPTAIGEKLLLPTNSNNTIDLTKNQLVIGKYNVQNNNALFIIGDGTDGTHRSNLIEVETDSMILGNINKPHTIINEYGQKTYIDNTTLLADIGYDTVRNISGTTTEVKYPYFTFGNRKTDTTSTKGGYSFAEGRDVIAQGYASHAEGNETTATGHYSHAEGAGAEAIGFCSHAEGDLTTVSGVDSHAEGYLTTAGGMFSHAQGSNTTANGYCETTIGRYNVLSNSTAQTSYNTTNSPYILVLGNGTGSNVNDRSNAMTVDWSGVVNAQNVHQIMTAQVGAIVTSLSSTGKKMTLVSSQNCSSSLSISSGGIKCAKAGYVLVSGQAQFCDVNDNNVCNVSIHKNSDTVAFSSSRSAGDRTTVVMSPRLIQVAVNDVLYLYVSNTSSNTGQAGATSSSITDADRYKNYMTVMYV